MVARQFAVGFGIAVVFPLLVYYGVATFYPPPEPAAVLPYVTMPPNPTPEDRQRFADQQQKREQEQHKRDEAYKTAAKDFARHLIIVAAPLGYAAIFIGTYLPLSGIGTGLIFGGIFTVGLGYGRYWFDLEDRTRFLALLFGFLVLLFVGWRRLGKRNTNTASP